jgi:hypothetical protein
MQKTKVEERPLPEYLPIWALIDPWAAAAHPPIAHRSAQKKTLSRIDIRVGLIDRIEACLDTTLTLERSVAWDAFSWIIFDICGFVVEEEGGGG